jgi:glycosyltransferase involved in cell wall biosynthesis
VQAQLHNLRNHHELIFVSSANWHPQKRLNENIRVFKQLKRFYPTACLIVMGSNAQVGSEKDVYLTGSLPHNICGQVFRSADWMIHTAWLDHCPNTVVEALACGVPIICTEDGGTRDLIDGYGIVLKESTPYDFSLTDYDSPPLLDVEQIASPLPRRTSLPIPPDVSIELAASRYTYEFERIIQIDHNR